RVQATEATRVYAEGNFAEILAFRWQETVQFIAPLVLSALPKTFGLMLLGIAAWRSGVLREPQRHGRLLWVVAVGGGVVGGTATVLAVQAASSGQPPVVPGALLDLAAPVPLALAYAAALYLWLRRPGAAAIAAPFAAAGQMALTNYLIQSVVLGFIFYG